MKSSKTNALPTPTKGIKKHIGRKDVLQDESKVVGNEHKFSYEVPKPCTDPRFWCRAMIMIRSPVVYQICYSILTDTLILILGIQALEPTLDKESCSATFATLLT